MTSTRDWQVVLTCLGDSGPEFVSIPPPSGRLSLLGTSFMPLGLLLFLPSAPGWRADGLQGAPWDSWGAEGLPLWPAYGAPPPLTASRLRAAERGKEEGVGQQEEEEEEEGRLAISDMQKASGWQEFMSGGKSIPGGAEIIWAGLMEPLHCRCRRSLTSLFKHRSYFNAPPQRQRRVDDETWTLSWCYQISGICWWYQYQRLVVSYAAS